MKDLFPRSVKPVCGIAAIFSVNQSKEIFRKIVPMCNVIRHRGSDDEGYLFFSKSAKPPLRYGGKDTPEDVYASRHPYSPQQPFSDSPDSTVCALGHRRLSIVDVSPAGHQPMCSHDGRLWITYNGEVYNYIEIREELIKAGHQFKSQTDTEVILKAYQHWGEACLHHFNGMFAVIIYDHKEHKLFAARDRFGVKPLYYWISPSGFIALASEIKQFTVLPGWKAQMNGQRAYDFLVWGVTDHTEESLFSHVKQLRGGEMLHCDLNNLMQPIISRWYTLTPGKFQGDFAEAATQFGSLLDDAVRLRLRADVDVGSCLSGGLDSSSIVCLANRHLKNSDASEKQKTFSACSHVKRFDERSFIDEVVSHCGVNAHHCYPTLNDLFERRDSLIWHQDEPFGSTSIYAQWEVFSSARQNNVKVMLDGQGADEQLAGYHGFFGNRFYELLSGFRWTTFCSDLFATRQLHGNSAFRHAMKHFIPRPLVTPLRKLFGKPVVGPDWLDFGRLNATDRAPYPHQAHIGINALSELMLTESNLPMLLHWEDRNSMAHSVESRTPFVDYRLIEFVSSLPSDFKMSKGITKRVMRESMKGILPDLINGRMDKMGFVTPEEVWVRQEQPELFRKALRETIDLSRGILKPNTQNILEDMISGKRPFNFLVWRLISFGDWMKRFSVKV